MFFRLVYSALFLVLCLSIFGRGEAALSCAARDLTILTADDTHIFSAEIANTFADRQKGLMFRREIAPDFAMLFVMGKTAPVAFWMKNTYVPLDLLFVDAKGVIQTVHQNARPHDLSLIPSRVPVAYVVEIAAGQVQARNIQHGDRVFHHEIKEFSPENPCIVK
ncbi:MAG: DUF192 domain-containing protein [Halocynthiibacter sp.]